MGDSRPDPDRLLSELQREEEKSRRGKLKIFFGASAGVGKTYAMLTAAQAALRQGTDVAAGVVETHGRKETAALLAELEVLPLRETEQRGKTFKEFDLDGALARKPGIILVDELAHTNLSGSRHPKRWQDVEELLDAGIDVYTTLNVQHLDSLNDVVSGITGILIRETVPDKVFDQADEVLLVDLTPDELLQRMKEGKVYLPHQAEHAIRNFFRKGNLIALRELALRRTADRIDEDVRAYRAAKSIERVWETQDVLLACVGPGAGAEKVVRTTARLADRLNVPWHAVYVETPALQRLPERERQRILRMLKLAQDLGAMTATLPGHGIASALVDYARKHNISKLVVGRGRGHRRWWSPWRIPTAEQAALIAPEIDVVHVGRAQREERRDDGDPQAGTPRDDTGRPPPARYSRYLWAVGGCALVTGVCTFLFDYLALANIVMIFLLMVVIVAVRLGRGPAVLASFLSVLAFDFFFVPPQYSFSVSDVQYLPTFAVMLAVGLITAHLTSNLRYQARSSAHRESRAKSLYQMARELSAALTNEQIIEICARFVNDSFRAKAAVLLLDAADNLALPPGGAADVIEDLDIGIAQWTFDHAQPAGFGTDTLPASPMLYLPLKAPMRTRGVLAVKPSVPRWLMIPEQRRQLETFALLAAIALERVHYVDVAQKAIVHMESERLRNSLLSALSHDLRTPLTALVGIADSLTLTRPALKDEQAALAAAMRDQALRLSRLVNNILDMARIESGGIRLRIEWQSVEEVIGSAIKAISSVLAGHHVHVEVPPDSPLVRFDAVMIERVLCNLLENAAKYTPAGSDVWVQVTTAGSALQVAVTDNGPGLPAGLERRVFEKFTRGNGESSIDGVGLGLAICRAIVEAHGGRIWTERPPQGGAKFVFTLPLDAQPDLPAETPEAGLQES